jgi:hypothetical protein
MTDKEETMAIINLLAGAAQAGAQGALAQAAFNLVKASEAKVKAAQLDKDPQFIARAEELVEQSREIFLQLANDEEALAQGKEDIITTKAAPYDPAA